MNRVTDTVKHLIIINIICYLAAQFLGKHIYDFLAIWFPANSNFGYWQLITHMFMHHPTFIFHIIFNMLALWMFGSPLEQMWGQKKFLFFYFSAGIGAVILPLTIKYYEFTNYIEILTNAGIDKDSIYELIKAGKYNTGWENILGSEKFDKMMRIIFSSSMGASGAIMGLLAAFGLYFPNAKLSLIFLPIPIAAKYFIPIFLCYELLSGIFEWPSIFGVNVDHFAHIGGAIIGFLIAWYWKKSQYRL